MAKLSVLGILVLLLSGCLDPEREYYKQIEKSGFIPFKQPMGNVRSGTILRGKPDQLFPMGPATSCFPDKINGEPTDLRWESDTTLPQTHYDARLAFNMKLNTIANVGTPTVTFKFDMEKITQVDFEAKDVTVDMLDQFAVEYYYQNGMSERCRDQLVRSPFVLNALHAKQMSFVFLDTFGGKINLDTDSLQQIVDIGVDINWHIENGYKLIITTPKYLGYHLGKLRQEDNGLVNIVSSEADWDANLFIWTNIGF